MIIERITRRALLLPSIFVFLSVLIRCYLGIPGMLIFVSLSSVLLLAVKGKGRTMFSVALTVCLMTYISGYFTIYTSHEDPVYGQNVSFDCKIHSVERTLDGTVRIRAYSSRFGFLEFKSVEGYDPVAGERISCEGYFFEADEPRDPGQFDYKRYLERKGIEHAFKPDMITASGSAPLLNRLLYSMDERFFELRSGMIGLYGDHGPLAASVFMGGSSLIADNVRSLYKRNGCAHILAVSGTHFAGFLALLTYFLDKGRKNRRKKVVYVTFCIMLATLTGWSSSVTRSCIMCSSSYCSKDPLSGLCTACVVMMLADPYSALSYGFLMTSSSAIAILCLTSRIRKRSESFLGKKTASVISPVIASQIGMLPFVTLTSQKYGVIPMLIQITTSFIASVACSFFVPSVILAKCFSPLFIFPSEFMLLLLDSFLCTADRFYIGYGIGRLTALLIVIIVFVFLCEPSFIARKLKKPLILLLCLSFIFNITDKICEPDARVVFIDVGQGDSCLILASGKTILIDGGTYDAGKDNVLPVLEYYDIRHIDVTIATHWDSDHLGGLLYLYQQGITGKIYTSFVEADMKQQQVMDEYLNGEDVKEVFESMNEGDVIRLSDECVLKVIYPSLCDVSDGENEDSLVILMSCNDMSMLFTGDLGIESEEILLDRYDIGKVDILKAGHHGSEYSTGNRLLSEISPSLCIISAGVDNQYGHPAIETLERLNEHDVDVISTQDHGAITVEICDDRYTVSGFLNMHDK